MGDPVHERFSHHLECHFDHALLREQLSKERIKTMKPFSAFPYLERAFTEGEGWPAQESRAERLLKNESITQAQFDEFAKKGVGERTRPRVRISAPPPKCSFPFKSSRWRGAIACTRGACAPQIRRTA